MMQWQTLLTPHRSHHELESEPEIGRSHFHKDHDRVVFSSAFRRLGRKTQVHPLSLNDHIHTRLTHSVEVGSVGRSLGLMAGETLQDELPSWINPADIGAIVQAACLAHDIGHPPFGHAGEYAVRDFFGRHRGSSMLSELTEAELTDLCGFESNAQAFRVVTQTEYHQFAGGMRLTYPTLGTLMKYPWTSQHAGSKEKFGAFLTEKDIFKEVAERLGLIELSPEKYARHPLAFLMEAADDICYTILDLEDAIELNILSYDDVEPILLQLCGWQQPHEYAMDKRLSPRRRISAFRGRAMERMLNSAVQAFMANRSGIMSGSYQGELLLDGDKDVAAGVQAGKQLAYQKVFRNARKSELEIGAFSTIGTLLEVFCQAVYEQYSTEHVSFRAKRVLDLMGANAPDPQWPLYQAYMRVIDYVTGMTDNYATYLAHQIGGMAR
ncbi:deoxyguanosinetriphosphate triphosphohydrolase [Permianibacter aggregans]|uniref:dGTPase n=2 Tax=Permianibacter aggregans TaxID=1510150 RepID=A0A4R6UVL6_9GAMM|nr:deoxyguanosinetriphosphate triphosphohydrolase [Permianibacter aggregans]TDQ49495.1 dGTPase [Permianibacter aggregans]